MKALEEHPCAGAAGTRWRQWRARWARPLHGAASSPWATGTTVGLLLAVNTVSYAAMAGAPLGWDHSAAAVLSGFIGAVAGGAVASRLGSVPAQVFAPRASVAVVIAGAATHFAAVSAAAGAQSMSTLLALTACLLLAGLIQVGIALLRLGDLIRGIPHAVTAGLAMGIAALLLLSQWDPMVGAAGPSGLQRAAPIVCGVATVQAIWLAKRLGREREALLLGLGAGLLAAGLLGAFAADGVLQGGQLLVRLEPVTWEARPLLAPAALVAPPLDFPLRAMLPGVCAFAVLVALVNAMETLTCAVLIEDAVGRRFDANRALMAGALGSLAATLLGGLPVAGGSLTSLANLRAGPAGSRTSAMTAAAVCAVLAALFGSWLAHVPVAVIAGLMAFVAADLAAPQLAWLRARWLGRGLHARGAWGDIAVATGVAALVLWTDMLVAVAAGLAAAMALALLEMKGSLVARHYVATQGVPPALQDAVQVIELGRPLFFATAEPLVRLIEQSARSRRFTLLDVRGAGGPDASAARALARCLAALREHGHQVLLITRPQALPLDPALDGCAVFSDLDAALRACDDPSAGPQDTDDAIVRELAPFVGPLAGVILDRALRHDPAVNALLEHAHRSVDDGDARQAAVSALATRLMDAHVATRGVRPAAAASRASFDAPEGLARAQERRVEHVVRALAAHVGPIAPVLVRRAWARAASIDDLPVLVAAHIADDRKRKGFLDQCRRAGE